MPTDARRLPGFLRPFVATLLCVCAWAGFPPAYAGQNAAPSGTQETFASATRAALARGRAEEAERMARQRPATDSDASAVLAQLAAARGEYDGALGLLGPAAAREPAGEAALQLGLLHQHLGRKQEATRLLEEVFHRNRSGDTEGLFRAARAAHALNRPREANELFRAASKASPDPAIEAGWGMLFLEKGDKPEAMRSLKKVLDAAPDWAPAHAALGRVLADEDPPAAAASANRALEIDGRLADAHLLLAELDLNNSKWDEARTRIGSVLENNASHLQARAWLAAIAYVRDDQAGFDAEVERILAINPSYAEVYRIAGDLAARNYRFEEAVTLVRRGLALDPDHTKAYGSLGMHLMRTGDEAAARVALERSFEDDPYDRVTYNLLLLLDSLDKFVVETSGDLTLKFHPDEAPVMREFAIPLAHEALDALAARYEVEPKGPILIEIFPEHDDFAVRTLGLPGMIGALGACFGRVVIMDSPRAKAPGTFSWQATLWHELAHVVTLQLSNQRVPRWLTEGISVYEEGQARPEWGRDMEVPFAGALLRGETLKLADLNAGFTRPETIGMAYYQASLLVDHIVGRFGLPAVRKLLVAYGEGHEGETALAQGLGVSTAELQESFDTWVKARFASLTSALRPVRRDVKGVKDVEGEGGVAALRAAAEADPGSYAAKLALGSALAASGDPSAFEPLERAAALVPMATGERSPNAVMARLAEKLEDVPRALRAYRAWLAHDHAAVEPARRMAALADRAGDEDAARFAYERIVALDPFDAAAHMGAGRLALTRRDLPVAIRQLRAALVTGIPDRASAHSDLAEALLLAGRPAEARKEALASLEIAPMFERAQELLLRAVERDEGR
jgi:cellulose synthase operon protein C